MRSKKLKRIRKMVRWTMSRFILCKVPHFGSSSSSRRPSLCSCFACFIIIIVRIILNSDSPCRVRWTISRFRTDEFSLFALPIRLASGSRLCVGAITRNFLHRLIRAESESRETVESEKKTQNTEGEQNQNPHLVNLFASRRSPVRFPRIGSTLLCAARSTVSTSFIFKRKPRCDSASRASLCSHLAHIKIRARNVAPLVSKSCARRRVCSAPSLALHVPRRPRRRPSTSPAGTSRRAAHRQRHNRTRRARKREVETGTPNAVINTNDR